MSRALGVPPERGWKDEHMDPQAHLFVSEPVDHLVIPLDYVHDRETQLNRGKAYVDVPVEYDPDLPVRGERRVQPYGPCPIVLREPNDQVLLHEILHVVIAGYGRPDDPHEHRLVNRIEVALWETGWRMTDPRFHCRGYGGSCPDSCYRP